jgi:hypothetical protein
MKMVGGADKYSRLEEKAEVRERAGRRSGWLLRR